MLWEFQKRGTLRIDLNPGAIYFSPNTDCFDGEAGDIFLACAVQLRTPRKCGQQ